MVKKAFAFCPGKFTAAITVEKVDSFEPVYDTVVETPFVPAPLPDSNEVLCLPLDPNPCGVNFSNVASASIPSLPSGESVTVVTDNSSVDVEVLDLFACPCFLQSTRVLALNGFDKRLVNKLVAGPHTCANCEWCSVLCKTPSSSLKFLQERTRHPSAYSLPRWRGVPPRHPDRMSWILLSGTLQLNPWYLALSRIKMPPPYETPEFQSLVSLSSQGDCFPSIDYGIGNGFG
jgi:hypothetical protein